MCMKREDMKPWAYVHDNTNLYEIVEATPTILRMTDAKTDQIVNIGVLKAETALTLIRPGVDDNTGVNPADIPKAA